MSTENKEYKLYSVRTTTITTKIVTKAGLAENEDEARKGNFLYTGSYVDNMGYTKEHGVSGGVVNVKESTEVTEEKE